MIIEMSAVLCATGLQDELEVQDMDYKIERKLNIYFEVEVIFNLLIKKLKTFYLYFS